MRSSQENSETQRVAKPQRSVQFESLRHKQETMQQDQMYACASAGAFQTRPRCRPSTASKLLIRPADLQQRCRNGVIFKRFTTSRCPTDQPLDHWLQHLAAGSPEVRASGDDQLATLDVVTDSQGRCH